MTTKLTPKEQETKERNEAALAALYFMWGVGDTIEHKFRFWEAWHKDGYCMPHNPTHEQAVDIFEMSWLVDKFPEDMTYA